MEIIDQHESEQVMQEECTGTGLVRSKRKQMKKETHLKQQFSKEKVWASLNLKYYFFYRDLKLRDDKLNCFYQLQYEILPWLCIGSAISVRTKSSIGMKDFALTSRYKVYDNEKSKGWCGLYLGFNQQSFKAEYDYTSQSKFWYELRRANFDLYNSVGITTETANLNERDSLMFENTAEFSLSKPLNKGLALDLSTSAFSENSKEKEGIGISFNYKDSESQLALKKNNYLEHFNLFYSTEVRLNYDFQGRDRIKDLISFKASVGFITNTNHLIYLSYNRNFVRSFFEIGFKTKHLNLSFPILFYSNAIDHNKDLVSEIYPKIVYLGLFIAARMIVGKVLSLLNLNLNHKKIRLQVDKKKEEIKANKVIYGALVNVLNNYCENNRSIISSSSLNVTVVFALIGCKRRLTRIRNDIAFETNASLVEYLNKLTAKDHYEIADFTVAVKYIVTRLAPSVLIKQADLVDSIISTFSKESKELGVFNPIYSSDSDPWILLKYSLEDRSFIVLTQVTIN